MEALIILEILFSLCVLLFVMPLCFDNNKPYLAVFSAGMIPLSLIGIVAVYEYQHNLEIVIKIENIDKKIENALDTRNNVYNRLESISIKPTSLMNADSPYSTLVATYLNTENLILNYNQEKVDLITKKNINERGVLGYFARLAN